jgi:arylsulfatase
MSANAQNKKPNLVMIMTDDVGWGDLGSYGGGVMRGAATPNLDRMAAEGMRFVNYYGQASCTAGRASFITGRIPNSNFTFFSADTRRSEWTHCRDSDHC